MKNILGNSIRELRKSKKMTQVELAKKTGYKQNTISNHENGNRQLDEQDILKYAKALEVEPQVLFDLSRTPTTAPNSLIEQISDKVVQLHQDRQKNVLSYATEQLDEQERELHEDPLVEYRIYEKLSAGTGTAIYDDHSYDLAYFDKEIDHDIASWIYGDSMEPKYLNGDVALIKETGFDYDGAIYAVVWDGQTYIKKVYRENNGLRLVSLNNKYSD
ncbi:TPA: S24 family peptidase, partial [Streptococcus suis]